MDMDKLVALCRRRGFLFQSSEIYGGLNGFWDYGPLGVELKRNIKEAWWRDMVTGHNELVKPAEAPATFEMVGLDSSIIMHPQVWKCSGHYDLFHDMMVDCRQTKHRYRYDQVRGRWAEHQGQTVFVTTIAENETEDIAQRAQKLFKLRAKDAEQIAWKSDIISLDKVEDLSKVLAPEANEPGTLTEPREFNLMFKTIVGAMGSEGTRRSCGPRRPRVFS
jgi:glycyl-tRNA synthetase